MRNVSTLIFFLNLKTLEKKEEKTQKICSSICIDNTVTYLKGQKIPRKFLILSIRNFLNFYKLRTKWRAALTQGKKQQISPIRAQNHFQSSITWSWLKLINELCMNTAHYENRNNTTKIANSDSKAKFKMARFLLLHHRYLTIPRE